MWGKRQTGKFTTVVLVFILSTKLEQRYTHMKLTITEIDKILFFGDADSVRVPGKEGEMTILAHHMPLISTLGAGEIVVSSGEKIEIFPVVSGFIDIGKTETTILV